MVSSCILGLARLRTKLNFQWVSGKMFVRNEIWELRMVASSLAGEARIMKRDSSSMKFLRLFACITLVLLVSPFLTSAQFGKSSAANQSNGATPPVSDYKIGPGDVITVSVSEAPDLSGKFRITDKGQLVLPGLEAPIQAEGQSAFELSKNIATILRQAQLLKEPAVNVFVEEYHSRTVTVLGAVNKPSVYPLQKPTSLLEILSTAGGLTTTAGSRVTIVRGTPSEAGDSSDNGAKGDAAEAARTIDLAELFEGRDPSLNVPVNAGDVITVATAPVVYVVGAVSKPGGFVVEDQSSGITVLQALARAEGFLPFAARNRSVVIRRPANGQEPEKIPVDLGKVMEGKLADVRLQGNDILFVPESGAKKNVLSFGRAAINGLVNGIAIYGLGPRIAR
jgi:polysaccharide biosynthesis/export protein